jgi:MFS family permease
MDTLGAVIGPGIALAFLYFYPGQYKILFLLAFLPGLTSVLVTLFVKENKRIQLSKKDHTPVRFFAIFQYWKKSDSVYKRLVLGLLFFALFNSSDVFLLLKMKNIGLSDTEIIGIYIFYNLVYALFSWPLGIVADIVGYKKILIVGLFMFSMVYAGFAINSNFYVFIILFFLYGTYAAATEGISKAWITNTVNQGETAAAIGTFSGLQSICTLVASSLAGFLWITLGATSTFLLSAIVPIIVIFYLIQFLGVSGKTDIK